MAITPVIPKEPIIVEPKSGEPVIKIEPPQKTFEVKKTIIRGKQWLWYGWMAIESLLFLRFLLKLLGANPNSGFSILLDILTFPFRILFNNLFPPAVSPSGSIVIDWSTLFAMLVYTLIVWVTTKFLKLKKPIDPIEAETKVEKTIP